MLFALLLQKCPTTIYFNFGSTSGFHNTTLLAQSVPSGACRRRQTTRPQGRSPTWLSALRGETRVDAAAHATPVQPCLPPGRLYLDDYGQPGTLVLVHVHGPFPNPQVVRVQGRVCPEGRELTHGSQGVQGVSGTHSLVRGTPARRFIAGAARGRPPAARREEGRRRQRGAGREAGWAEREAGWAERLTGNAPEPAPPPGSI